MLDSSQLGHHVVLKVLLPLTVEWLVAKDASSQPKQMETQVLYRGKLAHTHHNTSHCSVTDSLLPRAFNSVRRRQYSYWSKTDLRVESVVPLISAAL